ncbi:MAPEG family protein [Rheinheimera sp. MMS21-TC3]|uniref:MAPEG family protein n=1 Tax=Rheinheimera sp. MMS21-TC3 TaxID=3072790 RepID=UPI0028C3B8C6|nr:MAPEG family protein [Rheinheimera sp. MMS21-TC3]WNO59425.1 MAPEG family protein [Rheinheimera sp. MMS21-TC3]
MKENYILAYSGLLMSLITLIIQALIAAFSKSAQKNAIPGKIDESLSHASFVFRAHRTFMNSLENFPVFFGGAILAILIGADAFWAGTLIWAFSGARIIHMLLYYVIATEKNPSPRSYFYLIGLAATVGLLILAGISLI